MVRVRELSESEAQRLQRIVRRGAKNIVTWRRATVVLASAQGQKVSVIAKLVQTSEDRVREMIHNFNEAGMDSLFPKWSEGRPATFTPRVRARICRIARARPAKFGLPFTTWSLDKLRDYLVERRVVKTISKERLRQILAEEDITFQKTKSWKESPDPEKEDKLARIDLDDDQSAVWRVDQGVPRAAPVQGDRRPAHVQRPHRRDRHRVVALQEDDGAPAAKGVRRKTA
jgi:transposase